MMEKAYNLIIVDDHSIFRDALKFVLAQSTYINVVAEASNGIEFLQILEKTMPDLVLMDIAMPGLNGVDATKEALKKYPDLKVIALSMYGDELYYFKMLEAGAQGFVPKESGSDELLKAIDIVMRGDSYFSNQILCKIIKDFAHQEESEIVPEKKNVKLSKRENEVLELICEGYSNNEIAAKLGISKRTIEGHRSNLISKTGVKNSIHLVLFAMKNNILVE
jgi:DNA-binding NarL/FixJ family response regulator